MDLLQAEITGHLPLLAELKVAVEEANQRAEKEEREKLLKEAAERLQQEQQAISEKQTQLEQPVEQKMVWNADIRVVGTCFTMCHATSQVSTTKAPPTSTAETQATVGDSETENAATLECELKTFLTNLFPLSPQRQYYLIFLREFTCNNVHVYSLL